MIHGSHNARIGKLVMAARAAYVLQLVLTLATFLAPVALAELRPNLERRKD